MKLPDHLTGFSELRMKEKPQLPKILRNLSKVSFESAEEGVEPLEIKDSFPFLFQKNASKLRLIEKETPKAKKKASKQKALKVGLFFSGGPAAGGHNVIIGLFDALKKLDENSEVFGFLSGPLGLLNKEYIKFHERFLNHYLNQGGFDLLGTDRTKIETVEQFRAAAKTVEELELDGLLVIGGDDSNTNAAHLAEYFLKNKIKTQVIGVPKTIDGDLKGHSIEISFGFDTASKTYAHQIGSVARDALSQKKYTYFIKLMGRTASHLALECALQVHPNMVLIGEEIEKEQKTVHSIVEEISDLIVLRSNQGKDYGIILIPEGIIEFIEELKPLIKELNALLVDETKKVSMENSLIEDFLSSESRKTFLSLTADLQKKLLGKRDPHGNIQVSKIEIEKFLIELVEKELMIRKAKGSYKGSFNPQSLFFGYEGRAAFPSLFDCKYCYALGAVAALLFSEGITGHMASLQNLTKDVADWQAGSVSLLNMMHIESRGGVLKEVIKKAVVDLDGEPFLCYKKERENWQLLDDYRYPGPIQFYGPKEVVDLVTITLYKENSNNFVD